MVKTLDSVADAVVDRRTPAYMECLLSRVSKEPQKMFESQRRLQALVPESRIPTSLLGQSQRGSRNFLLGGAALSKTVVFWR